MALVPFVGDMLEGKEPWQYKTAKTAFRAGKRIYNWMQDHSGNMMGAIGDPVVSRRQKYARHMYDPRDSFGQEISRVKRAQENREERKARRRALQDGKKKKWRLLPRSVFHVVRAKKGIKTGGVKTFYIK